MNRQPLDSSNIKSVGFDSNANIMEVEFKSGDVYRYDNVSGETHQRLLNHPSPGAFLHASVKNRFPSTKVK